MVQKAIFNFSASSFFIKATGVPQSGKDEKYKIKHRVALFEKFHHLN